MKTVRVVASLLLAISQFVVGVNVPTAYGIPSSELVISHVITGESISSSSELVAIYNNSATDIDMTGYCIRNKSNAIITCVQAETNTTVYIRSHSYLTFASSIFAANHNYVPDTSYSSSNAIQVGGDIVSLIDRQGSEIDKVMWGTSGGGISSVTNGTLVRKVDQAIATRLVDTDITSSDFTSNASLIYPANASYDVVTLVDVCPNIPDAQQVMPTGYLADEQGHCQPDSCSNIAGLQTSVPDGYDSDVSGQCTQHDECDNISGIQTIIPNNMVRGDENQCVWDVPPLVLSEILPNAPGVDTGNEFIEVYNPTAQTIDLSLYTIKTGVNSDKTYTFPVGTTIAPGEYRAFTDTTMKFTLLNTSSRIVLTAVDGSTLGDTGVYTSPAEGYSWALINGTWQYTNQPTPGAANVVSASDDTQIDTTDSGLTPCSVGKYRNPLTNRCRTIETDVSMLATCDADQYRNPETGRCKKIAVTTLTPCKDNQYRSEQTNRCRTIQTASVQKPCKENQYRSEATNRCRNLPATTVPSAAFAVQPIKDTGAAFVGWWALGGVMTVAAGYAAWEWRREIRTMFEQIFGYFSK